MDLAAVDLIADLLGIADHTSGLGSGPGSPSVIFNRMALLRLARLNISWIASQQIVLVSSLPRVSLRFPAHVRVVVCVSH